MSLILSLLLSSFNVYASIEWGTLKHSFPESEKIEKLESPAMSYRTLLEWEDNEIFHCLIYQISSRDAPTGTIYKGVRKYEGCSLKEKDHDHVLKSKVKTLKAKLTRGRMGTTYQVITIDEQDNEEILKWQFPFGDRQNRRWNGLDLKLETLGARVPIATGKVCSFFDRENIKVDFGNCEQCPEGLWTPILNHFSASYPIAICGASECGKRNQNPCLRMTSVQSPIGCEEAKKHVYCQAGRSIICLGTGFLQCR